MRRTPAYNRRYFLKHAGLGAAAASISGCLEAPEMSTIEDGDNLREACDRADRTMWDAPEVEAIPGLDAEVGDVVVVRPDHPDAPVLVVKRRGTEALALIEEHRGRLWSRQKDAGEVASHV